MEKLPAAGPQVGPDGIVWFVETRRDLNRFGGFDTRKEEIVTTAEVPSGDGTVPHMVFHSGTGALWFGTDENTVGRAGVPLNGRTMVIGPVQGNSYS